MFLNAVTLKKGFSSNVFSVLLDSNIIMHNVVDKSHLFCLEECRSGSNVLGECDMGGSP